MGWGMGLTYSFGFLTVGFTFGGGYGGYYRPGYPPAYYRPPYYPPGGYRPPGGYPGYGGPRPTPYGGARGPSAGQLPAGGARPSAGQLPAGGGARPSAGQLPAGGGGNLYNGASAQDRVASTGSRGAGVSTMDRTASGANNVYADKSGSVHRQTSQGWESRNQGNWSSPSTSSPSNLGVDSRARQSGASSMQSRPSYGGSFGGGARGGGGGRRR
jgi:hypothetical protein